MQIDSKCKVSFILIMTIFIVWSIFINQAKAEESEIVTQQVSNGTRIVISTSGPVKFSFYRLNNPPRLVIEFRSKNVLSKIDKEVMINQGVIKRVTSTYFRGEQNKALKSLTFELTEASPHRIWQEGNTIILDIQAPSGITASLTDKKEIFTKTEIENEVVEKIKAMDIALEETVGIKASQTLPIVESARPKPPVARKVISNELLISPEKESTAEREAVKDERATGNIFLVIAGLVLISGLSAFLLYWYRLSQDRRLRLLELELKEKQNRLALERSIRKAIEKDTLEGVKEKQELKEILESLKEEISKRDELLKKESQKIELQKEELPSETKKSPSIYEKVSERRAFPRLVLSRDFSRTVILKIESEDKSIAIKDFANNISLRGVCFEAKRDFEEKAPINLTLFFYGVHVPIMKVQARIIWKKAVSPDRFLYGLHFDSLDEHDKSELNHYIESKVNEAQAVDGLERNKRLTLRHARRRSERSQRAVSR